MPRKGLDSIRRSDDCGSDSKRTMPVGTRQPCTLIIDRGSLDIPAEIRYLRKRIEEGYVVVVKEATVAQLSVRMECAEGDVRKPGIICRLSRIIRTYI